MEDPTPEQVEAPEGGCGLWEAQAGASSWQDLWTMERGAHARADHPVLQQAPAFGKTPEECVSNNAPSSVGNDEETIIRNTATEIKDSISTSL
ncbi:hypothetical protein GRJ2_000354900 [Grus japonensis]|uniref:Uncharacterized protein n=1 Tax=Grus japonensis TaxID=30415 RepID=A0ABC9W194_GRUJA